VVNFNKSSQNDGADGIFFLNQYEAVAPMVFPSQIILKQRRRWYCWLSTQGFGLI
jgi:hypothetical protein